MTLCDYLLRLVRLLQCRRIIVRVRFAHPNQEICVMSDTVTLNASAASQQSVPATATVTIDGSVNSEAVVTFVIADTTIASVVSTGNQTCSVNAIPDPSGTGTKTTTLTGTVSVGTQKFDGVGTVNVTTVGDTATVVIDFGTPTP